MGNRDSIVIKTSIIGIITNIFLAGIKALIGIITKSIAITYDSLKTKTLSSVFFLSFKEL